MKSTLKEFPDLVRQMVEDQAERLRNAHEGKMEDVQIALQLASPYKTGAFQESILPFGPGGFLNPSDTVTNALVDWNPELDSGHTSLLPYSRRLALGHSHQAKAGWMERAILKALS